MGNFLDNLIPLRKRLDGAQYAGWEPTTLADEHLGCKLLADLRIPVAPGISLSADVYIPKKPGTYPALLCASPYNKELHTAGVPMGSNEVGSPAVFTNRGYVHVILNGRGMGRSEGTFGKFVDEQEVSDYEKAIAWIAEQPWCNGDVGMYGASYYGMIQPVVAARRPPALKAFYTHEMCTDFFRHITNYGGTVNHDFIGLWLGANFRNFNLNLKVAPWVRALIGQLINRTFFFPKIVRPKMDKLFSSFVEMEPTLQALGWYRDLILHRKRRDDAMGPGSYMSLDQIEIPFVVVQNPGIWTIHQFGAYDLFEHAGTSSDRRWLILTEHEYVLPVTGWQLEAIAFFDHILKKTDNGYDKQPAFRYWTEGEEAFRSAQTFPIPKALKTRLYPSDGGVLTRTVPIYGQADWTAIPKGTRTLKGFEKVVNQKILFKLAIETPMIISGPITVSMKFSCNEIDSHVIARLSREDAAGKSHLLALGSVSPARSTEDPTRGSKAEIVNDIETPRALTPDVPISFRFSLTPAASKFKTGDLLVLAIASRADQLAIVAKPSSGFVHFDLMVPPYFSKNTLHFGKETYVEIDVLAAE